MQVALNQQREKDSVIWIHGVPSDVKIDVGEKESDNTRSIKIGNTEIILFDEEA